MARVQRVESGKIIDDSDDLGNENINASDSDSSQLDTDINDSDDLKDSEDSENELKVEPWMAEDESADVPVSTHIRMKQKLKGRLSDKNEELERLKAENETLKKGLTTVKSTPKEIPKKPKEDDFNTILEYEKALTEYENELVEIRFDRAEKKRSILANQAAAKERTNKAVDSHYERAAKLIQDSGIDTEVYKNSDTVVRESVDAIQPGKGDIIMDQIISLMGEGSEKVLYYLGRNKNALNEFKSLLVDDGSGIKASMFLGKLQQQLLNTKQKTSNAPPPDSDVRGDSSPTSAKVSTLLKKRKAAIKKGDIQLAYDIKKQAKAAGADVSTW